MTTVNAGESNSLRDLMIDHIRQENFLTQATKISLPLSNHKPTSEYVMYCSKLALSFAFVFASCLGAFAQEAEAGPTKAGVLEIYFAKDDGTGKAGEEATSFVTTDVPIYCVVQLDSALPTTVKMNLVAVAVPGVKAETKVVSTTYTTKDNQNRVNFSGRPAGQWVAGRYRVDIFVGSSAVVSREFAVQKVIQAKPVVRPSSTKTADRSRLAGPVSRTPR